MTCKSRQKLRKSLCNRKARGESFIRILPATQIHIPERPIKDFMNLSRTLWILQYLWRIQLQIRKQNGSRSWGSHSKERTMPTDLFCLRMQSRPGTLKKNPDKLSFCSGNIPVRAVRFWLLYPDWQRFLRDRWRRWRKPGSVQIAKNLRELTDQLTRHHKVYQSQGIVVPRNNFPKQTVRLPLFSF